MRLFGCKSPFCSRSPCEPRFVLDSNHKGNIAEAAIVAEAVKLGILVLRPQIEHGQYDLVFELGARFLRVQVKWARLVEDVVVVDFQRYRWSSRGPIRKRSYTEDEIDVVAAYCGDLDQAFLLPKSLVVNRSGARLRLRPTKNGQRAGLNWASDYSFSGAVAQLERAPAWHAGGHGFESRQLHSRKPVEQTMRTVGAHDFRSRLGYYMQLAAASEEIAVTRRGKPYVRLLPSEEHQPDFAGPAEPPVETPAVA